MLHLVKNGTVVMTVLEESAVDYEGIHISPATVNAMPAVHEGNTYILVQAPPEPEPEPLTPEELRAQMPRKSIVELRAVLRAIRTPTVPDGIYSDDIYAKIDLIADRDLREEARDFFDHGQYAERVNPWVDILGAMFGLSPEDIDDMWQAATAA